MADDLFNSFMNGPDENGRFGDFGGRFVSETLMPLILGLEAEYEKAKTDPSFWAEMDDLWANYVGRPSPLYYAERLTQHLGGAKIYLKRDELNHTGAHKINNVLGQILLARRMGKKRIIAETGAGQHGVATATVCAKFGLQCVVYMGKHDVERQAPNVFRHRSTRIQKIGQPEHSQNSLCLRVMVSNNLDRISSVTKEEAKWQAAAEKQFLIAEAPPILDMAGHTHMSMHQLQDLSLYK